MEEQLLTILTPTYNRRDLLPRLYDSLRKQTNQDFQWLVIDDGSTDGTMDLIRNFHGHSFSFDFYTKPNGGKHTALNYAHPYVKGKLTCIVDSDDWLLPHAVQAIIDTYTQYQSMAQVGCLTFLKGIDSSNPVNGLFPEGPVVSNEIDFKINGHRMKGDCCEVIYTKILKDHPFPEYDGEKFMGEGYLWNYLGFRYDSVYINQVIYICEYLEGGLSKSGRLLRVSCPYGGMANSNSFLERLNGRKVNFSVLVKEVLLFICYGKFAGLNYQEIRRRCKRNAIVPVLYPFGIILYFYWKKKYVSNGER